jgi:hypothetical protein
VEVSVADLIRLGKLTEAEIHLGLKQAVQRLKREGWVRDFRRQDWIFVLNQKRNGDCVFLDTDLKCSVYENRPEICRSFPRIGPRPGFCPYDPRESDP